MTTMWPHKPLQPTPVTPVSLPRKLSGFEHGFSVGPALRDHQRQPVMSKLRAKTDGSVLGR